MVLLSRQGLSAAQIAVLLECHPATVRRWIGRFNSKGAAGWPACRGAGGRRWAGGLPGGLPRCWSGRGRGRYRGSGAI
jgi:hypothetical protein